MSIVVVGADYLGSIEKRLQSLGVTEIVHISGRKAATKNKVSLPKSTAFVLVMTDYVNHRTAETVKNMAKSQDIPLVFSKRSWSAVEEKLTAGKLLSAVK
ncbi:MAG: DUF2325 domain-containing protein [Sporomusaceae bacterium]|nr:DUF2325 domain-containing protein [Sporomusaceae bacterium]